MTLIEGVGDEVVQFMAIVLILTIGALAWWSTNARPDRYRTVLVMRSRPHHPVTLNIRTSSNMTITNTPAIMSPPTTASEPVAVDPNATDVIGEVQTSPRVITLREMDSIVDADMAMLDNNRLHFYRRMDSTTTQSASESTSDESEVHEEVEPASNAQIREMDSIVNAMEADVTAGCDFFTRPNDANPDSTPVTAAKLDKKVEKTNENVATVSNVNNSVENNETNGNIGQEGTSDVTDGDRRKILIKLKYINDTLKEVDGSLDELLKDFKWRHFSSELTSECRVRLIFNGRVLLDDAATLRACGLHDKAVVHCLVHPKRDANQERLDMSTWQQQDHEDSQMNATHELITEGAQPERAWDLENILMTLVSVALTVVWFFRCEYSNMFTASASVALFGLTVFYSVAIFGLYLSDTFHFDRRPAAGAVPNN